MKKTALVIFAMLLASFAAVAQTPAFPGAYGGGMYATGGRGGQVLYVTNLKDYDKGEKPIEGSFRWAVEHMKMPRTVCFKVSGIIHLTRKISIKNGDLTIAGQTAPGDGICIADQETTIGASNVIVRYMRFRPGHSDLEAESDAMNGRAQNNVIIDHCSMSWSVDECASFYDNKNFTMQWCIIAESLCNSGHSKGAHGYGGIWGGENASFHHNLLINHLSRNPRLNGLSRKGLKYRHTIEEERCDLRNNVICNWGNNGCYGGESAGHYNLVANYFKPSMGTKESKRERISQIDKDDNDSILPAHGLYYVADNYLYGVETPTGEDWKYMVVNPNATGVKKKDCRVDEPYKTTPIMQHTAEKAFMAVMSYVGANLVRDAVDQRLVQEAYTGRPRYKGSVTGVWGIIDKPSDVGGYPEYYAELPLADTDADGIPDGWIEKNAPGKKATDLNAEGYTYLEVYMNSLVEATTSAEYAGATMSK